MNVPLKKPLSNAETTVSNQKNNKQVIADNKIIFNLNKIIIFGVQPVLVTYKEHNKSLWIDPVIKDQEQSQEQLISKINHLRVIDESLMNDFDINLIMQAWTEYHWYWVAYWRLHLTKAECNSVYDVLEKTGDASGLLGDFLEKAGVGASKVLISNVASAIISLIANDWLTKDGMTIHFVILIPVYFEIK